MKTTVQYGDPNYYETTLIIQLIQDRGELQAW